MCIIKFLFRFADHNASVDSSMARHGHMLKGCNNNLEVS